MVDADLREPRGGGFAYKPDIAAEAATFDLALSLPCIIGVCVGLHHGLEWQCDHVQAQDMGRARARHFREIQLPGGKSKFAHRTAVDKDGRVGIEVLDVENGAPSGPILGDCDCAFVPCAANAAEVCLFPARMRIQSLIVAPEVVLVAGPTGRHFVVPPR